MEDPLGSEVRRGFHNFLKTFVAAPDGGAPAATTPGSAAAASPVSGVVTYLERLAQMKANDKRALCVPPPGGRGSAEAGGAGGHACARR